MCGIAGLITAGRIDPQLLRQMTSVLAHRGPDGDGCWIDRESHVGLGHRRLAVVDLSPQGRQPMVSSDGRWTITYNGEIYNHVALRSQLDPSGKRRWRGHSDTEILIECIAAWGLERTLSNCVGMFALALWDSQKRVLHLARDRFGEKPLYYGWVGGDFVFGSELKAIQLHPRFSGEIQRHSVEALVRRSYIPAPLSIYKGIFKLEPGCLLSISGEALGRQFDTPPVPGQSGVGVSISRYWSYRDAVIAGLSEPFQDEQEAADRLHDALMEAIKGQAVADVPVGAFLSGGIDSSLVVGLYQKYSPAPVRTFSIGFDEPRYNEANFAKAVARHFGTEHNERYVTAKEAQEVLPLLPVIYDEPFADSSQIPTFLVSKFAREQVTVAISGDGGDELFGGYNRYLGTAQMWARFNRMPAPVRKVLGRALAALPAGGWDRLAQVIPGGNGQPTHFGAKVRKTFSTLADADSLEELFNSFVCEWGGTRVVTGDYCRDSGPRFDLQLTENAPEVVRMMYCDATSFLTDDVLCKVDRAAMANSLETRVPFLDHRVAEVAARIPLAMKVHGNRGKIVLRSLLYRDAPPALFERPKAGFIVPVGEWMKGPLRPWVEAMLDPRRLDEQGFFDGRLLQARWNAHVRNGTDPKPELWPVLMFQTWLDHQATAADPQLRYA